MQVRTKVRKTALGVACLAAAALLGCGDPNAFQPIAYDAKPWQPPPGWDPEPPCVTGYYVALDSCPGCTGISYALCTGIAFSQCVCGVPFTPGAPCPQRFACPAHDFPPHNWAELSDYAGPGCAGLQSDAGAGRGAR